MVESNTSDILSDDEFDVEAVAVVDTASTIDRLKHFSYYLVENVELNLNFCLNLLEERDVPRPPNSVYIRAISKFLSAVPKVGSGLGGALAESELYIFGKVDKKNSRTLADLVYHFSDHKEEVRNVLIQSAVDIFYSFENQFMKLSCEGRPKRAMQKLAKDAADRIFNYFLETKQQRDVTRIEVTKGVLFGDSKRNKVGIKEGKTVTTEENSWKTSKMYAKTGIVLVEEKAFYKKEGVSNTEKYGHRRLLPWETAEEVKADWQLETGFEVATYTLSVEEDFFKLVRDYIMTKNPNEEAQLERENYSKEALEDRQAKHEEVLEAVQQHFSEVLGELQQQYQTIVENHREHKEIAVEAARNQNEDKVLHVEINTKLEEIKKNIDDTKALIERNHKEVVVVAPELTIKDVQKIVQQEVNVEKEIINLVKDKLRKNDVGPRIHKEVDRTVGNVNKTLKNLRKKW
ncbi:hypothetical protein NQ315_007265 [Exocentrus adspersus]|uniref:Uncharacterized protein n=1 Tax=Exocentrus adspersus TaxID=1586481 RepID=A0AAV8WDR3_9CUCU|nr:hypothetical protein NQ315_007265 [Exocentrus adspersus]